MGFLNCLGQHILHIEFRKRIASPWKDQLYSMEWKQTVTVNEYKWHNEAAFHLQKETYLHGMPNKQILMMHLGKVYVELERKHGKCPKICANVTQ